MLKRRPEISGSASSLRNLLHIYPTMQLGALAVYLRLIPAQRKSRTMVPNLSLLSMTMPFLVAITSLHCA